MKTIINAEKVGSNPYLFALYGKKSPKKLHIIHPTQRSSLGNLSEARRQGNFIHVVFDSGANIVRAWRVRIQSQQFAKHHFNCQLVGLSGAVDQPRMVVPLRSDILYYVQTVAFRGSRSQFRMWLKWLACLLPGDLTWHGPLILTAAPDPEVFDRFVLLTGDREIAFLFRNKQKAPWSVRKSGAREELVAEHRRHNRAVEILGRRVPALFEMTENGTTAAITLEAIPEMFLGNIVAAALWRKKEVFVCEALGHLHFCREIYYLLAEKGGLEQVVVDAEDVRGLLTAIDVLLVNNPDASLLKQTLTRTIGLTLPQLIQHGDFCVRNVLIAGGERGRVLIDWEDMQERRWPLADFVLLRLSLKEVYAGLFAVDLEAMERLPELAEGLARMEAELMDILNLDRPAMHAAKALSLACLCRQNIGKGRLETAKNIFRELMAFVGENLETPVARAAS